MAVTITKRFWDGTAYKSIAKVVFTSPNFTSPAVAGTRSHMQPGGKYMGTWFEAVDFMYREFPNQNYAQYPTEMEGFFGKLLVSGTFTYGKNTLMKVAHPYGTSYPIVVASGIYPNIIYTDKNNYGVVTNAVVTGSGIFENYGILTFADVTLGGTTAGSGIINSWITSSVSGTINTTISGTNSGSGSMVNCFISTAVTGVANDVMHSDLNGFLTGTASGIVNGISTVSGTVAGTVSGTLYKALPSGETISSTASARVNGYVMGPINDVVFGTLSGTVTGNLKANSEYVCHQYSDVAINATTVLPRKRRHHGGNSIIFTVTFGEAYDCRLTAWDDNTHSTTDNKILAEEHYRVDAVAFRSSTTISGHNPTFRTAKNLVYPACYDRVLKGNEKYYGDFDLIFSIDTNEYGEFLVFTPRMVNIDDTFIAGSYDFITTLHYQYT